MAGSASGVSRSERKRGLHFGPASGHAFGSEGSSAEAGTQSASASSSGEETTLYVGSLYEEHSADKTHFIFLGGTRIASVTNPSASGAGGKVLYYHTDHLGGTKGPSIEYSLTPKRLRRYNKSIQPERKGLYEFYHPATQEKLEG